VLAKRSPVARDLRVIMAFSKAVTDLERLGDEAAKIAYIGTAMYNNDHSNPGNYLLRDVSVMSKLVSTLLKEAIEILDVLDLEKAEKLLSSHDDLEEEFQAGLRRLTTYVLEDARNVGHIISIVLVMKSLLRIGEHARNLAEYVVYMVSGEDIRHAESDQA
jgi:phosphate transport system protein